MHNFLVVRLVVESSRVFLFFDSFGTILIWVAVCPVIVFWLVSGRSVCWQCVHHYSSTSPLPSSSLVLIITRRVGQQQFEKRPTVEYCECAFSAQSFFCFLNSSWCGRISVVEMVNFDFLVQQLLLFFSFLSFGDNVFFFDKSLFLVETTTAAAKCRANLFQLFHLPLFDQLSLSPSPSLIVTVTLHSSQYCLLIVVLLVVHCFLLLLYPGSRLCLSLFFFFSSSFSAAAFCSQFDCVVVVPINRVDDLWE